MSRSTVFIIILLAGMTLISLFACKHVTITEYYVEPSSCTGCGECYRICPNDAIYYDYQGKAQIDQTKCTHCAKCVAICPNSAIY